MEVGTLIRPGEVQILDRIGSGASGAPAFIHVCLFCVDLASTETLSRLLPTVPHTVIIALTLTLPYLLHTTTPQVRFGGAFFKVQK